MSETEGEEDADLVRASPFRLRPLLSHIFEGNNYSEVK